MNYDNNVYSHPESWGFRPIAEIDYSEGYYQFDIRIVWIENMTGVLYSGRDKGCSCPSPFENVHNISDLHPLNPNGVTDMGWLEREVGDELVKEYSSTNHTEAQDFLRTVRRVAYELE